MRFRAHRCLFAFCLLPALLAPLIALSYSGSGQNVPAQRTGGFGEQTCTSCHSGTLNPSGGSVTIGRPAFYLPAWAFQITITIQDGAADRRGWGFQLSARFANGKQAGSFIPRTGLYVQTVQSSGVQYVSQRPAPVQPANSYTFTVDWVAPPGSTGGDVIFNAAGMASDGSGSGGDHVFTAQAVTNAVVTPVINAGGIVNAASYEGAAAAAAPGSLISIFGLNLSPAATQASALPLPTELGSTSALIGDTPVPLLYVSPTQVNAQVPFAARPGQSLAVTLRTGDALLTSAAEPVQVEEFAPAFFSLDGTGRGAVAALHADYRLVNDAAPGVPGDYVLLYCTGLGLLKPPLPADGHAATDAQRTLTVPTLTIGGLDAHVDYAGAAPGFVGLYQINAIVPSLRAGIYEVMLYIGGKQSQAGVTIRLGP